MYHAESDTPARVRTMNLNEDLGQVCCDDAALHRMVSRQQRPELMVYVGAAVVSGEGRKAVAPAVAAVCTVVDVAWFALSCRPFDSAPRPSPSALARFPPRRSPTSSATRRAP